MLNTTIVFEKAQRKKAKARIAICAPAGGGKTYGALLLGAGLGGPIALIDTENGSASLEAGKPNIPEFDIVTMHSPFDPEKYNAAIKAAEKAGYKVIIIDSLSHAWAGTGGLLEKKDALADANRGDSWNAWRKITPQHNKLVETMLQSECHIIATMRSKTDYAVEMVEGKTKIKKVGLAPVQREGMDYEFTIVFDVDQSSHVANASKDRTSLFDSRPSVLTIDTGKMLKEWLESGASEKAPAIQPQPQPVMAKRPEAHVRTSQ